MKTRNALLLLVILLLVGAAILLPPAAAQEPAATAATAAADAESAGASAAPGEEGGGADWLRALMAAGLLGGGATLGWTGHKKMAAIRVEPQPLEVRHSPDYVTKREFSRFQAEVNDSFKGVHARISQNDRCTSEIKGRLDKIDSTQQEILNLLLHRHDEK